MSPRAARSAARSVAAKEEDASDGRALRGVRSKRAIVDAILELVGEGAVEPTAQAVAERANVGLRSVFRHFSDMESLFAAMDERMLAGVELPISRGTPPGTLSKRARDLIAARVEFYEYIAPYKRAGNRRRSTSRFLTSRHRTLVRELRADLMRRLPELAKQPGAVADALDLVLSFEAWDRLRSDSGLSRARAQAAVERAALAVLAPLG